MASLDLMVDLQRPDGSTIRVLSYDEYVRLSADEVAETIPALFRRCACGARVDLGTMAELVRAIGAAAPHDFARTKVAR